jgi:Rieske 2Fe-2S family protein
VRRILCPYHQWAYGLDGALRACGGVDVELGIDRDELRLGEARVEEVSGLVFVSMADDPPPFEPARSDLERMLAHQGLGEAKVAARLRYEVRANWKLVWENNRECWHCHVGHPEYVRANYDTARDTESTRSELASRTRELRGGGLDVDLAEIGLAPFPSPGRWWSANRTPNVPGFVTESLDGAPIAPPMGSYGRHDVGTLRVRVLPGFWCHASADHAVTTRVLPAGPLETMVEVTWLVDATAEEGFDYELDRLLPFWRLTSEQDWELCERNQRGVLSSGYRPGPYSPSREGNVIAFVDWYLDAATGRFTQTAEPAVSSEAP